MPGSVGERRFQMALADEAPRANDVGNDVDGEGFVGFAHACNYALLARWPVPRLQRRNESDNPVTMAPRPNRFDVFCRVVDNFGDAGVALRLSRQLAREHAADVTLWIDDVARLARIASAVDVASS